MGLFSRWLLGSCVWVGELGGGCGVAECFDGRQGLVGCFIDLRGFGGCGFGVCAAWPGCFHHGIDLLGFLIIYLRPGSWTWQWFPLSSFLP